MAKNKAQPPAEQPDDRPVNEGQEFIDALGDQADAVDDDFEDVSPDGSPPGDSGSPPATVDPPEAESDEQPETDSAAEPVADSEPETQPESQWDFMGALQALGFQDVGDVNDGQKRLAQQFYQTQLQLQRAQQERQYYEQQLQQLQNQPPPQDRQPEQPAEPEPVWNPPQVDQHLVARYMTTDEAGNQALSANAPAHVRDQYEKYQAYRAKFAEDFLSNPVDVINRLSQQTIEQQVKEQLESYQQTQQQQSTVERIKSQYGHLLYATDPMTNQLTNTLSPSGDRIVGYIQSAMAMGVTNPDHQWNYAMEQFQRDQAIYELQQLRSGQVPPAAPVLGQQATPVPPAQAPTPAQVQEQRRQEFQNRTQAAGAPTPPKGGSFSDSGAQRRSHQSDGEEFAEALVGNGVGFN